MYGLELRNKNGVLVLGDNEYTLQYWGKLTLTFPASDGASLFNLPAEAPCSIFVVFTSGSRVSLNANNRDGIWKIYASAGNGVADVYVFTDSSRMPRPPYGLEIYNSQGRSIFCSKRPLLQVQQIHTAWVSPLTTNMDYSPEIRTQTKVACPPSFLWGKSLPQGPYVFLLSSYHCVAMYTGSDYIHGVYRIAASNIPLALSYGNTTNMKYPTIDASYYDRFSNLPNYV